MKNFFKRHKQNKPSDTAASMELAGLATGPAGINPAADDQLTHIKAAANQAMTDQQWEKAGNLWQEILAQPQPASAEVYKKLSIAKRSLKQYDDALHIITKAAKQFPDNLAISIERAEVLTAAEDWQTALEQWQSLLNTPEIDDYLPRIYARIAFCQNKLGDLKQAETTLSRGLQLFPDHIVLLTLRADMAMEQKAWQLAADLWETAFTRIASPTHNHWLGRITSLRLSQQYEAAEQAVTSALQQHADPRLRMEWAEIPTSAGDWPEAFRRWQSLQQEIDSGQLESDDSVRLHVRFNCEVISRLLHIDDFVNTIKSYRTSKTKRKYAILTSFSDGYDALKLPLELDDRFDYFVYTDAKVADLGIYKIQPFPIVSTDNGRTIRYVKTHPHVLAKDYEAVIWVDSSFLLVDSLYSLLEKFLASHKPIASTPHQHRQSIFEELEACIARKKDDPKVMKAQVARYQQEGFDGKTLAENGILMFNLKHPLLPQVLETWWHEIEHASRRDQLSFGYALFKHQAEWHHIVDKPLHMRNFPAAILTPHFSESAAYNELVKLVTKYV